MTEETDEPRHVIEQRSDGTWDVLDTWDDDDPFLFNFDSRSEALFCAGARNADPKGYE